MRNEAKSKAIIGVAISSVGILLGIACLTMPYTNAGDLTPFSGKLISHSRSFEAVILLSDGKEIFARSNDKLIAGGLRQARNGSVVSGRYLKDTHNVVELSVNGVEIAGFEHYQQYEKSEYRFLILCFGILLCSFLTSIYFYGTSVRKAIRGRIQ